MKNSDTAGLGLFIAIGLSIAGYFIGQTMYNAKVALNTAQVRGLAERKVKSDSVSWILNFSLSAKSKDQVPRLYKKAEIQQNEIVELLENEGLSSDEITKEPLSYSYVDYRDENQKLVDEIFRIDGSVEIQSQKVSLIKGLQAKIAKLITQGIQLRAGNPMYKFTQLNSIKPDMLKEATKNARLAAAEFAKNAGVHVGGIRSARQGNFSIRDFGENYGDSRKVEKVVRVVTQIEFYLK